MKQRKFTPCLMAFFAGAIGFLAYSPYHYALISFFSFSLFLFLIINQTKKQAALRALFWGLGYFTFGIYWVYVSIQQFGGVHPIIASLLVLLLAGYLTLYPILFAVILRACHRLAPSYSARQLILLVPLLWQATEFLRSTILNGFSWLQFGYTQLDLVSRSWFPVIGIDGVNLLFSLFCGVLIYTVHNYHQYHQHHLAKNLRNSLFSLSLLLLLIVSSFTLNQINWVHRDDSRIKTVALIQGNIAQSLKWDPEQLENTKSLYFNEILNAAPKHDLIILPEAAIPSVEVSEQNYLKQMSNIATTYQTSIALGIIDYRLDSHNNPLIYNSVIVFDPDTPYSFSGNNRYSKQHLVPFGEYTPLQSIFKPISELLQIPMSNMTPGEEKQNPIKMSGSELVTAICYEIVYTDRILKNFTPTTNYLLTISNDGWFGDTTGPWQHLQMAQARSLEFGRPMLRETNTGRTAIIDEIGNIQSMLPQFIQGTLSDHIATVEGFTPYSQYEKKPYYILMIIFALIFIFSNLYHYKSKNNDE